MKVKRTFDGDPVVGEFVSVTGTLTQRGKTRTTHSSGIYLGVRPSEWDGVLYHFFSDGEINGLSQGIHGFPVSQFEGR